jgi:hypothetical protein
MHFSTYFLLQLWNILISEHTFDVSEKLVGECMRMVDRVCFGKYAWYENFYCDYLHVIELALMSFHETRHRWLTLVILTTQEAESQEDCGSKLAQANSLQDPISEKKKKPFTKKGWWSGSKCRPWVQAPYCKKKKKLPWNDFFFPLHAFSMSLPSGSDFF